MVEIGERLLHSYSTTGRGVDILLGTYNYLDLTPSDGRRTGKSAPMVVVLLRRGSPASTIPPMPHAARAASAPVAVIFYDLNDVLALGGRHESDQPAP